MLQDIGTGRFDNHFVFRQAEADDLVLIYREDAVLVTGRDGGLRLPQFRELPETLRGLSLRYAFSIDGDRYFFGDVYHEGPVSALPEELIFPRDFAAAHARFTELLTAKQNAGQDAGIRKNAERMAGYAWADETLGLMIRPAVSTWELITEGKTLRHCVGTYAKAVARGETAIFFIRRIDRPDEPFFTLEWKNGKVEQNRGEQNRARTPEVRAFEDAWLAHLRELAKTTERRSA